MNGARLGWLRDGLRRDRAREGFRGRVLVYLLFLPGFLAIERAVLVPIAEHADLAVARSYTGDVLLVQSARTWFSADVLTGVDWTFTLVYLLGMPLTIVLPPLLLAWRGDLGRPATFRHMDHIFYALMLSRLVAIAINTAYPAAPPRFQDGIVDVRAMLDGGAYDRFARDTLGHSRVASIPSMHIGFAFLSAYGLWRTRLMGRSLMFAYGLFASAVVFATLWTGDHSLLSDGLSGILVTLVVYHGLARTPWLARDGASVPDAPG